MSRATRGCGCAIAVLIILLGASAIVGWKWVLPWWRSRPPKPAGELQVHVLDVGPIEGDSVLIISPAGKAALIDNGVDLSTPAPEAAANPKGKGAKAKSTPTPPPPKKGAVTAFFDKYQAAVKQTGAQYEKAQPGKKYDLGGGAMLT